MNEPTIEQRVQFQKMVTEAAESLTPILAKTEPHVAVMALITMIASAAQATKWTRDQLLAVIGDTYDRTQATMAALGIKPGEDPPADLQDRIKKMMAAAQQGG